MLAHAGDEEVVRALAAEVGMENRPMPPEVWPDVPGGEPTVVSEKQNGRDQGDASRDV
jgi:hypothetical protein